jgi:hypothetical protein
VKRLCEHETHEDVRVIFFVPNLTEGAYAPMFQNTTPVTIPHLLKYSSTNDGWPCTHISTIRV